MALSVRLLTSVSVEHRDRQILPHSARPELRVTPIDPFLARNTTASVGIGFYNACIDRGPFASNQSFGHTSLHYALEHVSEDIALPEPPMPVLRETGVIRHLVFKTEAGGCNTMPGVRANQPDRGIGLYRGAYGPRAHVRRG
jgi:hypothetical protein